MLTNPGQSWTVHNIGKRIMFGGLYVTTLNPGYTPIAYPPYFSNQSINLFRKTSGYKSKSDYFTGSHHWFDKPDGVGVSWMDDSIYWRGKYKDFSGLLGPHKIVACCLANKAQHDIFATRYTTKTFRNFVLFITADKYLNLKRLHVFGINGAADNTIDAWQVYTKNITFLNSTIPSIKQVIFSLDSNMFGVLGGQTLQDQDIYRVALDVVNNSSINLSTTLLATIQRDTFEAEYSNTRVINFSSPDFLEGGHVGTETGTGISTGASQVTSGGYVGSIHFVNAALIFIYAHVSDIVYLHQSNEALNRDLGSALHTTPTSENDVVLFSEYSSSSSTTTTATVSIHLGRIDLNTLNVAMNYKELETFEVAMTESGHFDSFKESLYQTLGLSGYAVRELYGEVDYLNEFVTAEIYINTHAFDPITETVVISRAVKYTTQVSSGVDTGSGADPNYEGYTFTGTHSVQTSYDTAALVVGQVKTYLNQRQFYGAQSVTAFELPYPRSNFSAPAEGTYPWSGTDNFNVVKITAFGLTEHGSNGFVIATNNQWLFSEENKLSIISCSTGTLLAEIEPASTLISVTN